MSADSWNKYRGRITELANDAMRVRYLSSDANVGSSILQARKKGLSDQNLFALRQGWSPISWEPRAGLHFEISELNMMALGASGLDPEIDQIMVDSATEAAIENHGDIISAFLYEAVHGAAE